MRHGPQSGIARNTGLVARAMLLAAVVAALMTPAFADAASVAYLDNGEVWLASLDGTQKARLAVPVVNGDGDTENWVDVAQSDGGRIVAVRNKPGGLSNLARFKIWEPNGTSTVEGPLNAPGGWAVYGYPLGFDITADGSHLVYGYSNSSVCCPTTIGNGTYVRPATNSALNPIDIGGETSPSLFGARVISVEDSASPSVVNVQDAGGGNPYTNAFTPWLDTSGIGLDLDGVDVAANGALATLGFETYSGGTQTVGMISCPRDPGSGSGAHVPRHRGLLPACGGHRTGRIARAGRRGDRVEGRRRREGRRQPLDRGRPLRDGKRAGSALPDGHAPVDWRRRRCPIPAQADGAPTTAAPTADSPTAAARSSWSGRAAGRACRDAPGEDDREGAGRLARHSGQGQGQRSREGLHHGHRSG